MKQKTKFSKINKNIPLVIGSFDVLHKGHKKIFDKVKANKFNVLLIYNSPNKKEWFHDPLFRASLIRNKYKQAKPYWLNVKEHNFSALGFIYFLERIFSPNKIIVGSDFKFGKNRTGNVELLKQYFKVNTVKYDPKYQTKIIKVLYKQGKVAEANKLLVHKVMNLFGEVTKGKGEGKKLGFPTLNVVLEKNQFKFKPGTYASVCSLNNKNTHLSATCIYNNKHHQIAETFILDRKLKSYKYDDFIIIGIVAYAMPFKKISNKEKLIRYINKSVETVIKYFKTKL